MSPVLCKRDAVASMFVAGANEEGLAMASDENVGVFMDGYTGLSEDGSSQVLPTLMRDCGKSSNESARAAFVLGKR